MKTYTKTDLQRDGYFNAEEGNIIAEEIITDWAECLPPTTWARGYFQPGEAAKHVNGVAYYDTFKKLPKDWHYLGLFPELN